MWRTHLRRKPMTYFNQSNVPAIKCATQSLCFEPKLYPWDKEFPDAPEIAFRLWILKNYAPIFDEKAVRKVEQAFEAC